MEAVQQRIYSLRQAEDEFGVPYAALSRYCQKDEALRPEARSGPETVLSRSGPETVLIPALGGAIGLKAPARERGTHVQAQPHEVQSACAVHSQAAAHPMLKGDPQAQVSRLSTLAIFMCLALRSLSGATQACTRSTSSWTPIWRLRARGWVPGAPRLIYALGGLHAAQHAFSQRPPAAGPHAADGKRYEPASGGRCTGVGVGRIRNG